MSGMLSSGNPYTEYLEALNARIYTPPASGFKIRLLVLWVITDLAFLAGLAHGAMLLLEMKRKRNDSLWSFRLVQRPQGKYIVTNVRVVHVICSVVTLGLGNGLLWTSYNVNINHGSFRTAGVWSLLPALAYTIHGWLISWGQLQGYLLTRRYDDRFARPLLVNALFLGLGTILILGALAYNLSGVYFTMQYWDLAESIRSSLSSLQQTWMPGDSLDLAALLELNPKLARIENLQASQRRVTLAVGPISLSLVLCILIVNIGSIALTQIVKAQIKSNIEVMTECEFVGTRTSVTNGDQSRSSDDHLSTSGQGSANSVTVTSRLGRAFRPRRKQRSGTRSGRARSVAELQKAEGDLVLISTVIGVLAAASLALGLYGIYVTAARVKLSAIVVEFLTYTISWLYGITLAISSVFFVYNSVVHLGPKDGDLRPTALSNVNIPDSSADPSSFSSATSAQVHPAAGKVHLVSFSHKEGESSLGSDTRIGKRSESDDKGVELLVATTPFPCET